MSRETHLDVLIAGAGPGGATAAYFLSRAGARVMVLERERLPRYKPCGGAVPRVVYDRFPFSFADLIEAEPDTVTYCWRAGEPTTMPLQGRPVTMVMRAPFDLHILQQSGATVRDQATLTCAEEDAHGIRARMESGEILQADFLIGADGAYSGVARWAGLRRRRALCAALEAEVPADAGGGEPYVDRALFDFGVLPWAYLWIFPKREHLSVGIGLFQGKSRQLRQTLVSEMGQLGVDLSHVPLRGHMLPLYRGRERWNTARVLLVGDAAGLVDPMSGEGIRHAVESGRLAAQAILDGQAKGYTQRLARYARRTLEPARALAQILYGHPQACFRYGMSKPLATRVMTAWMLGQATGAQIVTLLAAGTLEGAIHRR